MVKRLLSNIPSLLHRLNRVVVEKEFVGMHICVFFSFF